MKPPLTEAEISAKADRWTHEAMALSERASSLLFGAEPGIQGGVLAVLLARFIAGHFAETPEETTTMRRELLERTVESAIKLIPIEQARILATVKEDSH